MRNDQNDPRFSDPRDPRNDPRNDREAPRTTAPPSSSSDIVLHPAGDYPVVPIFYQWGYAGSKNEQIGIRLRIIEGKFRDKTLLYYGSFHENSKEYTLKALNALNINDLVWGAPKGLINNGSSAIAVVQHETYKGKVQAKVAWINGADVQMKDEMNENELRAFKQRMRGDLARSGGSPPQSKARDDRPAPRRDDRPPPHERPNPAPGREYGQSYNGPAQGGAPADDPWNDQRRS